MRRLLVPLALSIAVACTSSRPPRPAPPDVVLLNGKVFTSDASRPWVEAIAIRGDRIIATGATNEIRVMQGYETKVVNLLGRTVVPGINDAHVHAPGGGGEPIDVAPAASVDDVFAAVAAAVKSRPAGSWILAEIPVAIVDDPRLTRDALDAVAPQHPVRLGNLAGHSELLNSAALRRWNIAETESDPPGGRYGRANGRLDGWLYEHAIWAKDAAQTASLSDEALVASVRGFAEEMLRYGVTSVQSMPIVSAQRLEPVLAKAAVPLRFRLIGFQLARVEENPAGPVKYILDGTPIERGAALSAPYADRPSEEGRMNYSDGDLRRIVDVAAKSEHPLLLHVAGDVPLAKLFAAMRASGADWSGKRVRIEHGDFIAGHAAEARELGVVLVQNPAHFMIPDLMHARLGAERMRGYQALRSISERGIPIAIGSDGPRNPWLNVLFATIHPGNPTEALTREQAVRAYTAGSAYAEFAEKEKGTLAPGMLADLAILSQDVFTVPPPELPKTTALVTMIGGKVVHGSLDGL